MDCVVEWCDRRARSGKMCNRHYERWRRTGNVSGKTQAEKTPEERFWERVDVADCWEWRGSRTSGGYGHFEVGGRTVVAHRLAYRYLVGAIDDDRQLDHLCRNRLCVNPDHLEPVTARQNTLRSHNPAAINAAKTHCSVGHPFDTANTYQDARGQRGCRRCRAAAVARYRAKGRIAGVQLGA